MSRTSTRCFILSLTVIIFTLISSCVCNLNLSGDMVSFYIFILSLQSKCLKLKEKYPGLNCNELENDFNLHQSQKAFLKEKEESLGGLNSLKSLRFTYFTENEEESIIGEVGKQRLNSSEIINSTRLIINHTILNSSTLQEKETHKAQKQERERESNKTESLFSVKSANDLQLNFDLNNTKLNETMEPEEFLRMIGE